MYLVDPRITTDPHVPYTRCLPKKGTLKFPYFDIRKYSIFSFHQINHGLLKRMIPRYFLF